MFESGQLNLCTAALNKFKLHKIYLTSEIIAM